MDWDRPYLTMAYEYEASILQAFGDFVAKVILSVKIRRCLGVLLAKQF